MKRVDSVLRTFRTMPALMSLLLIAVVFGAADSVAQTAPIALPNTISTYAGGGATTTAGAACAVGSPYTATDAFGDGCPASMASFGSDGRGGLVVDGAGNVFVSDVSNELIRWINSRSGVINRLAGGGTACGAGSGQQDKFGDGCPAAQTTGFNSPRGLGIDAYGNVFNAGYNDDAVNIICQSASPLCPNTVGAKQVGSMYRIAGCVAGTTVGGTSTSGTTAGSAGDGTVASPFGNLAGDVAAWGTGSTAYGTCSATTGGLNGARGVAADRYGNVYIADTGNNRYRVGVGPALYNGVVNPLAGVIALDPTYASVTAETAAGRIYPILGGFTAPTAGVACAGSGAGSSLDTKGDGCPFYQTAAGSGAQGIAVDALGNVIFGDNGSSLLRVLYMGGAAMANAITVNNPTVTAPVVGSVYVLAGGGSSGVALTPSKGTSTSIDSNIFKVTVGPNGDIFIGDGSQVLFYDLSTGYVRKLFASGVPCATALNAIGDGCPAAQAAWSGGSGLGVGLDPQGNLYITDTESSSLVRRIAATSLVPLSTGASLTQTVVLHGAAGTTGVAVELAAASPDLSAGTVSCGAAAADATMDCTLPVIFAPTSPGERSAALVATASGSNGSASFALAGTANGAAVAVDSAAAATTMPGAGIAPVAVALDGSNNLYAIDASTGKLFTVSKTNGNSAISGTLPSNPSQITVDAAGNIYAVGSGSSGIAKFTLTAARTYTESTINYAPPQSPAAPQGIAVDGEGNLYVSDKTNLAVYEIAAGSTFVPLQPLATIASGLGNPTALALDGQGNLYIADQGAGSVVKVSGATGAQTTVLSSISPAGIAGDAAGNLYVQDRNTESVIELPTSGPQTTVVTGLTTPTGLAVDGSGNLYSADSHNNGIAEIERSQTAFDFGTSITTNFNGTLTNVGNAAATGFNQTDTADFQIASSGGSGCTLGTASINPGYACTLAASFTPSANGTGAVSDVLSLTPASSIGSLTLTGTKTGMVVTTATAISGETPSSPVYSPSSTEVSFTVTVTPSSGSVSGTTVQVTVDAGSPQTFVLAGTTATVALTGLSAGMHSVTASYPTQAGIVGSTSSASSFTIAQATSAVIWTPASTTQAFSAAIGASVLDASSGGLAGFYTYTATPAGGSAFSVDASTYLPVGSYALAVTFTPADSVDYTGSTAAVAGYTVSKADTTAAVGATQSVVTTDGTGNFPSVQAAVNALSPTTGGAVYIKPGTYTGFVTVNTPFVSLRGLGGNSANVILTNEDGAFSAPFLPGQGVGNNGSSGDQGSSTMVVAKGSLNGTTYIPNGFYMENLSVANTYDTDSTNSNTNALVGGVCTAGQAANNNQALFNAGTLCNSQALALWITSDQAVLNNVQLTSLQDTLYAGSQGCGATCVAARQYFWKGRINGDVDYIFGDAATVFDHTVFYSAYHGTVAGTDTIEAQNKKAQTGSASDYLSGYILNNAYLLSQSTGMNSLYYGRPYGQYSTYIMLNSFVDQVNPTGWIEFSSDSNLPTSTYAEFNTMPYTDPATGSLDPNGFIYAGAGGSSGAGIAGPRETISTSPGTPEAENAIKTSLTAAQAAPYYPVAFLSSTVPTPSPSFAGFATNWDPTAALAAEMNAFVPSGSSITVAPGSSVTILVRPQTPGAGSIPTGTYTVLDGGNVLTSGTLDASGEAYYTTSTLAAGNHSITTTYGGDANFNASSSTTPFVIKVIAGQSTTTALTTSTTQATPGESVTLTATVAGSGGTPTGSVTFAAGATSLGTVPLPVNGVAALVTTSLPTGVNLITATYSGDNNFGGSSASVTVTVAGQFSFSVPSLTFASQLDGTSSAATSVTLTNNTGGAASGFSVVASAGFTLSNNTCGTALTAGQSCSVGVAFAPVLGQSGAISGTLTAAGGGFSTAIALTGTAQEPAAAAVATGDSRTVVEPSFPSVCQSLTASFHDANEDVPASVEAVSTNLDQARLQAALNACTGTNQAVELSIDGAGDNSFLSGPLTIPSGVTLLVDPGVTLYFSRNAQDYDTTQGVHTCGTVNASSNTASCQNLISISNDNNSGIMGYGKLNGRGGDVVLNSFPSAGYEGTTAGKSWWDLANDADTLNGSQQNPRGIQISKSTNITLYKITFKNPPNFHIAINTVTGLTAWDIKIVTPFSARNTDGIDPGNATNVTIKNSYISDGDDNVAVGAPNSATANISVVDNHFYAGHGESIGSITQGGVTNVLFDHNQMYGDADVDGSNSTGIRIKSANDRGGVVQNIQYSNSCFVNHGTQIQFTPLYNTNTGTLTPNFKNILLQNLRFSNQGAVATGSVTFLGASNNGTVNPLVVTLDNVTIDTLASSNLIAPSNAQITLGPGQVSSTLTSLLLPYNGSNGNIITDARTTSALGAPDCSFTFLAPELTGPNGTNQTVTAGQFPTAVVILTPAVASKSYPYPTGTVTLTDDSGRTFTATLPGSTDTAFVPITNAPAGTHTYTASYSGDSTYAAIPSFGSYAVTVNSGSLSLTTTSLTGVPSATTFGAGFTATAMIAGTANTAGSVTFLVNGATYATIPLASGSASYNFNLPLGSYSLSAVYSGDANNAGSVAAATSVLVNEANTATALQASATTGTVGTPITLTATVTSVAGTPAGTVQFSYTTSANTAATVIGSATLTNGVAIYSALLPEGTDNVSASYVAGGNFGGSTSTPPVTITINPAPLVPVSAAPVALPLTISTIAGGGSSAICTGSTDKFNDGCQATSVQLTGSDLRSVAADAAGNVYFTDSVAALVRKIDTNGVLSNFAGYVSGTTCVPTGTIGCAPTTVKLTGKPRGIYVDAQGDLFIAGYGDNKVQEVRATDGMMYLIAGTGSGPANTTDNAGDGGPAINALMKGPRGVWTDAAGNIYIADSGDNRIREVFNPLSGLGVAGNIQTVAGTGVNSSTGDGGLATAATISNPQGVAVDANGNIYIAESSHVRVVCVTCTAGSGLYDLLTKLGVASPVNGNIYTVAGTATTGNSTLAPGLANTVNMGPQKISLDADGNIYIADSSNNVIWFEDGRSGYTRVIAGGGSATSCSLSAIGDGCVATQAIVGSNGGNGFGLALDVQGNLYISDSTNFLIRKVSNNLSFASTAVGASLAQTIQLHFVPGDSPTDVELSSPDFTLSAGSCTVNTQDNSDDCAYTAIFKPATDSALSAPFTVSTALNNPATFTLSGTGTGPIPGTVQLITTATLTQLSDGSYQAAVTIVNNGTGTAQNVMLTAATLGSASGTPLPLTVGYIAPAGGSATVTVSFASSAGAAGAAVIEKYSGSYTGGTFGGSIRAKLP
jgi:polygalacturonase/sugar lactone lactonase YvrE